MPMRSAPGRLVIPGAGNAGALGIPLRCPHAMATTILFGAFDRHNLGDLLFAHVAATLLPRDETVVFAGLAARDLRPFGGHRVEALHALRDDRRLRGARLVHVGGEILTCRARDAAVMLVDPAQVDATLAFL